MVMFFLPLPCLFLFCRQMLSFSPALWLPFASVKQISTHSQVHVHEGALTLVLLQQFPCIISMFWLVTPLVDGQWTDCLSPPLMEVSCAQANLTSWYDELDATRTKENSRTPSRYTERMKRLVHRQLIPEIMRLVYWLKVNSSVTMFTDHCWSIPFRDHCFQSHLLCCIIAFRVWAWFLVSRGHSVSGPSGHLDMS